MAVITEVQIINPAGIPVYYHNNAGSVTQDDDTEFLLQASFITALSQFASELQNGDVRLIQFELKDYLLSKGSQFVIIFTSSNKEVNLREAYDAKIKQIKDYLNYKLLQLNLDFMNPSSSKLDSMLEEFDAYLRNEKLVEGSDQDRSIRKNINSLVFKSVGYEPGKCNIGRAERMKRLAFGLTFFSISTVLFALIVLIGLPSYLIFVLAVPNFLGFLGFLQYFYRFCTTNALSHSYSMM